ncbi:trypsin-like peptidase domain-containing protein [Rubrolithibacter danxiaensis]|uniref:trypsin-like peptidase domain-containing protein n=1 Tax=Rubrolithibacter danxiaensis TaxID=3390805 RepID=UPI003BF7A481
MKKSGIILVTALITAVVTLGAYRYIDKRKSSGFLEDNQKVNFVNNPARSTSSAGNPDFVNASAAVIPAVVHIKTVYSGASAQASNPLEELFGSPRSGGIAMASGSGVLITDDGYIVTNNHVVEDASQIAVVLADKRSFKAKLVGRDPSTDLALIKIDGKNLPIVRLGNSDNVQVGEWVLAVGFPLSLNSTVTAGIISAKGRSIGILDRPANNNGEGNGTAIESFIQTDAAINPGNSGGALVNAAGELVGINSAIASQTGGYQGYGFAIPVNLAKKIVTDFRKYGEVRRGYLGVSFPAPTTEDQLLRAKGINPSVQGVYIMDVQPGSAAAAGGLKAGDVIKSIDGSSISSSAEFSERIARHSPGDKVELSYLRNGKTSNTTVTLKGQSSAEGIAGNASSSAELQQKLGASFSPIPGSVKQRYGLKSGIVVTDIARGGFFEQAGVPKGTVITAVNGQRINSLDELNEALGDSRNGMVRIDGITPDGARFVFNFPLGA